MLKFSYIDQVNFFPMYNFIYFSKAVEVLAGVTIMP